MIAHGHTHSNICMTGLKVKNKNYLELLNTKVQDVNINLVYIFFFFIIAGKFLCYRNFFNMNYNPFQQIIYSNMRKQLLQLDIFLYFTYLLGLRVLPWTFFLARN